MSKQVQWYPGHMFKAKKEIEAKLKIIDLVVEIIDARVPLSSHNDMLTDITKRKKRLIVMSKADMVETNELNKFVTFYKDQGTEVVLTNLTKVQESKKVLKKIEQVTQKIKDKHASKGVNKVIRILVMGMPNVGKSTFINYMLMSKKTNTGNKPGVTKQQQWVSLSKDLELLDTPGILVPKIEDIQTGYNLVLCSLIKEEVVPKDDVSVYLISKLLKEHPKALDLRYNIKVTDHSDIESIYNLIGRSIGALLKGNEVDYERVTNTLINDFRNLNFGKIILDNIK